MISKLIKDESGQGMTEYILIVALVAIAAIVIIRTFGTSIMGLFGVATAKVTSVAGEVAK